MIEREKLIKVRVDGTYGGRDGDKIRESGGGLKEGKECDER